MKFFNLFIVIYLTLTGFHIAAEEEDCDILCKAGIDPVPFELKDKEKPEKKKRNAAAGTNSRYMPFEFVNSISSKTLAP